MQKTQKQYIQVDIINIQKKTRQCIKKLLISEFASLNLIVEMNCIELICDYLLSYNANK
jgi:hypothetical protein